MSVPATLPEGASGISGYIRVGGGGRLTPLSKLETTPSPFSSEYCGISPPGLRYCSVVPNPPDDTRGCVLTLYHTSKPIAPIAAKAPIAPPAIAPTLTCEGVGGCGNVVLVVLVGVIVVELDDATVLVLASVKAFEGTVILVIRDVTEIVTGMCRLTCRILRE